MLKHRKYGGSTARRTMNCPAWLQLSADVPKHEGKNAPADQGTMLHNCMEAVYSDAEPTPEELLKKGQHYNDEHLTQELIDTKLLPAIEAMEDLIETHDIDDYKTEPFVEIADDIGGSIDFIGISTDKKTVVIVDYKFGYVDVPAKDNDQLRFYALAAATDAHTRDWFDEVENIVLAIIQPNDSGNDLETDHITMEQLDAFESDYLTAVEKSEEANPTPVSGAHCKYCPAHAVCPVKTGLAIKASRITEIHTEKLAEYLPMAEELLTWAKEVQKLAHEQLELGTPIKGYKLVQKRATRVWNDIPAVEMKVRKAKKIKIEDGFTFTLKSPAQLEKVAKQLKVPFTQYDKFISAVSSGTTLAKEEDPRPAALPVAGLAQLNSMNE